jgi:hypothetical protein
LNGSTETARQRQRRALLVSLLEPIFEEDTIEARFFAKMKDEADLETRRREAGKELRPLKALSSCLCREGLSVAIPF